MPKEIQEMNKFGTENAPRSFFDILDRFGKSQNSDGFRPGIKRTNNQ